MNAPNIISIILFGTLLLTVFAFFLTGFLIIHKQKQLRSKTEKEMLEYQHEKELLHNRLTVQEQSQTLISQELHDNIGQSLSVIKMQLFYLLEVSEENYTKQKLSMLHELMGKTIGDLRSISHTLNSNLIARIGITEAINRELEYVRSAGQAICELKITGNSFALPPEKELLIFRIAQEAISNILRHAQAKNIQVTLSYETDSFTLSIADDGIGFDPELLAEGKGIGLMNMYERARILQGTLTVQNAAVTGGSIISLTINHQTNGVTYQNSDSR